MPRYFFTVEGGRPDADAEGTELEGPEEAQAEAVTYMAELVKDIDGQFWHGADWTMRVTDERGATVCTLSFRGTTGEPA